MVSKITHFFQGTTGSTYSLLAVLGLLIYGLTLTYSFVDTPIYTADEIGYLNNALALSGAQFDGELKYFHGYSFLLAPIFYFFKDLEQAYDLVQALNKILIILDCFLLYQLIRAFLRLKKRESITLALGAISYPSILIYSNLALSENILVFQVLALVLILQRLGQKGNEKSIAYSALMGLILIWTNYTHPRALPFLLIISLSTVILLILKHRKKAILPITALIAAGIIAYLLGDLLRATALSNYTGDPARGYGGSQAKSKFLLILSLFSLDSLKVALGQLIYIFCSTAGLILPFLFGGYHMIKKLIQSKRIHSYDNYVLIAIWLSIIASYLLSVSFMSKGVRGDQFIYGRYNEIFASIIIIIGIKYIKEISPLKILLSGLVMGLLAYFSDIHDLTAISTINVTSFWPHINFQIDQLSLWIYIAVLVSLAIRHFSNISIQSFIISIYFITQVYGYNLNWFEVHYPWMEVRQLSQQIDETDLVSFDCEDFYGESIDGCFRDYTGCYEWLYQKYSFLFAWNQIDKLYFEQWLRTDRNIFFSSTYHNDYKHLIRDSEATVGGRHYLYAKYWYKPQNNCFLPNCYKWNPKSKKTHTGVGKIVDNSLKSTNQPGALLYGPYIYLPAGTYQYKVYGRITRPGSPFFDITYGDASDNIFGEYILYEDLDGTLIDTTIEITTDLPNMQTRVIVGEYENVELDSIEITKIE